MTGNESTVFNEHNATWMLTDVYSISGNRLKSSGVVVATRQSSTLH